MEHHFVYTRRRRVICVIASRTATPEQLSRIVRVRPGRIVARVETAPKLVEAA